MNLSHPRLSVRINAIPTELRSRQQWVVWRYSQRNGTGKPAKKLYNPHTLQPADVSNSRTWGHFTTAFQQAGYDGIGFVFSQDNPFVGVDLDHCRDAASGDIEAWAQDVIRLLNSYTEISP
jgi:primase-polymerase (primpol)-like protein